MSIEPIAKPDGYEGAYRFFRNPETGRAWKVKVELNVARAALVESTADLAPGEYSATVTVSPVDESGQAVREGGKPLVIDSHTHTFTHWEMGAEDFDPEARLLSIAQERIDAGEARLRAASSLKDVVAGWS